MTTSAYSPDSYAGDGATTTFAITFGFLGVSTNVKVSIKVNSTGVVTEKTAATHYNITGSNVVFTAGNIPASGETVLVELDPDFTQDSDYTENSAFPAETLEADLDERNYESQINKEKLGRALLAPVGTSLSTDGTIPLMTANELLRVNSSGNGFESTDAVNAALESSVTPTDGVFIVGDGTDFVGESGATARTSIGLGTGDNATFTNGTLTGTLSVSGIVDIASEIQHTGDTNNKIGFTTDTQTFTTGGSTRMDITDSGVQLGGSGARVTTILDEDAMGSDSATALATQQSIKAYVDTQLTAEDLDITSDSGTIAIDLDSETLTIAGGTGIDTSAATNTLTIAIDSTVLQNVVEDTTPQLGGMLDVNGQAIGDGTRELLTFTEDASAVNHINIENEATGSGPIITSAGDDTNINLLLGSKGTGSVLLQTNGTTAVTVDSSNNARVGGSVFLGTGSARVFTDESYTYMADPGGTTRVFFGKSGGDENIYYDLFDAAGASSFKIRDSGASTIFDVNSDGDITVSGALDAGAATSLEIPNGTSMTTNAAGEIALDTNGDGSTITTGVIQVYDGTQNTYVVSATNFPSSDNDVPAYDSATNSVVWQSQTGGGGGLNDIVDDTTPQLGGMLDVNGNAIGDGTRELLTFTEDASAVNHINIENEATGSGPILSSVGDDTNVDLNIDAKGTGTITIGSTDTPVVAETDSVDLKTGGSSRLDITDSGVRLGAANARVTTVLDEDTMSSDSATALATQQSIKAYVDSNGGGAWELISTSTASTSASIAFTGLSSTYEMYKIVISDLEAATDGVALTVRTSTNNGSSYDSSAGNYKYAGETLESGGASALYTSTSATSIYLNRDSSGYGIGNAANEFLSGEVNLHNPSDTNYTKVTGWLSYTNVGTNISLATFSGVRLSAADVDAIQLLMSSGNIDSGTFKLYGLKAS